MLSPIQTENRKKGVGASESAIILDLNKFTSPYDLWLIKTGQKEAPDLSDIPQVYWGCVHEDIIAKEYEKVMNCKVHAVPETLFHAEYPHILCHLDRVVTGKRKILECKFAMFAGDQWGPSGSDIVPMQYIIQVQHQMAVTGYEEADIAVLIGGWDFRVYHFKRDEQLINKIIKEVSLFWDCVTNNIAPPLRDRKDIETAYPFPNKNIKDVSEAPEILSTICQIKEIKHSAKELDEKRSKLEDDLTKFIKDAEGLKLNDQLLVTWKANVRGSRVLRILEK